MKSLSEKPFPYPFSDAKNDNERCDFHQKMCKVSPDYQNYLFCFHNQFKPHKKYNILSVLRFMHYWYTRGYRENFEIPREKFLAEYEERRRKARLKILEKQKTRRKLILRGSSIQGSKNYLSDPESEFKKNDKNDKVLGSLKFYGIYSSH